MQHPLRFVVRALATLALMVDASRAQGPPIPEAHPPDDPVLTGSQKAHAQLEMRNPQIEGRVSYTLADRKIFVQWIYTVDGYRGGTGMDPSKATWTQSIAVDAWPTEVTTLGPQTIAFAGADDFGNTIVQILTFEDAETPRVVLDGVSKEPSVPPLFVPYAPRTVLRVPAAGGHHICYLFRNRGAANRLLLQFFDSRQVFDLDLATRSLTLVAAPESVPGSNVLVLSELRRWLGRCNDGEHRTLGHLYWIYDPGLPGKGAVLLRDADKDGSVDSAELLEDWTSVCSEAGSFVDLR